MSKKVKSLFNIYFFTHYWELKYIKKYEKNYL